MGEDRECSTVQVQGHRVRVAWGLWCQVAGAATGSVERQVGRAVGGTAKLGKGVGRRRCRRRRRNVGRMLLHHLHKQLVPPRVLQAEGGARMSGEVQLSSSKQRDSQWIRLL